MDIILVHGFGDSGRRFARLQRRLVAAGHHCHCPTLKPADAWHGIADLARKLDASHPVHAFQVRGLERRAIPDWSVRRAARRYAADPALAIEQAE